MKMRVYVSPFSKVDTGETFDVKYKRRWVLCKLN